MTDEIAPPEFHIHFEGEGARSHTLPGSALAQAIESLQRSIHLLAFAYEGLDFKERLRFSHDMERKYAVVVKVPGDGGYDIPYIIGNTAGTLFDPQDVRIVTEQHQASLAAVQANDPQALKRIIPHAPIRRQLVTELQKMQPPKRMGLVVSIEDCRRVKLLDGHTALAHLAPMLNEPVTPSIHPSVVTGRLEAIDFQSRSLTLQLPNGRRLRCTYNDDFEPVLLENPREWIQMRGEAVLDEDDSLKDLINISEITEVDDDPVTVDALAVDDATFTVTRPLAFQVSFAPAEGIYTATGDFHMLVSAETRAELENSILEALEFLWKEYVAADASTFTTDALDLREQLTNTFAGADNAA